MRKIIFVFSLLLFFWLIIQAFGIWQNVKYLKSGTLILEEEIKNDQYRLKEVERLPSVQIHSIEESYQDLNEQINKMSRYYNTKISLKIKDLDKEGIVSKSIKQTSWPGIEGVLLHLNFYDLKEIEQFMTAYVILERIESSFPLKMIYVVQKDNYLESEFQLYGREI